MQKKSKSMKASVTLRIEKVDVIPTTSAHSLSTYLYCAGLDSRGDIIYVGCDDGRIVSSLVSGRSQRVEDVSTNDNKHTTEVTCLMFSRNKTLSPYADGYLFSGSNDRTIKVWNPSTFIASKVFVTTCYGHEGGIMSIVDGHDGSFLSSSVDGCFKRWTPQKERTLLLHPFFECTFSASMKDTLLPALAINPRGSWSCFVGDSEGNLHVYRKDQYTRDKELYSNAPFHQQLTKHAVWEKFHRLGINFLAMSPYENYIISLSYDGTCKLSDCNIGCVFFTIENPKRAVYTGAVWAPEQLNLYLVDELGNLEVFNSFQEKVIASAKVKVPKSDAQRDIILLNHKDQLLTQVQRFRESSGKSDQFMLLFPATNRIHGVGNNAVKQFNGELSTWRFTLDNKAMKFMGHDDIVVGLSVLSYREGMKMQKLQQKLIEGKSETTPAVASASARLLEVDLSASLGSLSFDGIGKSKRQNAGDGGSSTDSVGSSTTFYSNKQSGSTSSSVSGIGGSYGSSSARRAERNLNAPSVASGSGKSTARQMRNVRQSHVIEEIGGHKPCKLISKDECLFFSVSTDASIRCWNENDGTESYRFKDKSGSEITCVRVVWSLNCIATGHENGLVSIWHGDSGSCVTSRALHHSITGLVEARNAHSQLLVGSDLSGEVAIWNLTLYRIYPSRLSTDRVFKGYHEKDYPGISSLTFHAPTLTMFSGGDDKTIRSWRIQNDTAHATPTWHGDVICALECTTSFLISGDESGEVVLWRLLSDPEPSASISSSSLPTFREGSVPSTSNLVGVHLSMLAKWNTVRTSDITRALCSSYEFDKNDLVVMQSGRVPDRSQLWRFTMNELKSTSPKKSARKSMHDLLHRSVKLAAKGSAQFSGKAPREVTELPALAAKSTRMQYNRSPPPLQEESSEVNDDKPIPETDEDGAILPYILFPEAHPDMKLSMSVASTFVHEGLEISCAQINLIAINNPPVVEVEDTVVSKEQDNEFLNLLAANQAPSEKVEAVESAAKQGADVSTGANDSTADGGAPGKGKIVVPPIQIKEQDRASVAFGGADIERSGSDRETSESTKDRKVGVVGVYLGTTQGCILRYEVELPIKDPTPSSGATL